MKRLAFISALAFSVSLVSPAWAVVARIDAQVERLRNVPDDGSQRGQLDELHKAIAEGDAASKQLRDEIHQLEVQKEKLQAEKADLQRVQTILSSGLIAAAITAFVAIVGLFVNMQRSRADRDFRRLEVIEKAFELNQRGLPVPPDIKALLASRDQTSGGG